MIQEALRMDHTLEDIQVVVESYLSGFQMIFSVERYTIDWIDLEVSVDMGCAMSPFCFSKLSLKASEKNSSPSDLRGGCYILPLKAFMDDTTILCSKINETHRIALAFHESGKQFGSHSGLRANNGSEKLSASLGYL
ncbi:reverse transcriptase [Plakobranchus ocellatus]|uniref:Reverse transcriptase n=1 Tax=Plakobranchus ocellatus TaxID=259542 RepID=A0AAV4ARK2_9GAST|nr:reverse transcriptase [Plakobranchus ocellatus]